MVYNLHKKSTFGCVQSVFTICFFGINSIIIFLLKLDIILLSYLVPLEIETKIIQAFLEHHIRRMCLGRIRRLVFNRWEGKSIDEPLWAHCPQKLFGLLRRHSPSSSSQGLGQSSVPRLNLLVIRLLSGRTRSCVLLGLCNEAFSSCIIQASAVIRLISKLFVRNAYESG